MTVRSPFGQIAIAVTVTTDLVPGTVAVPHGWGHKGTGSRVIGQPPAVPTSTN